ncbi:MAG: hypothetical protein QW273_01830 [Candidatus Pacearchaeota archaeon]
MITNLNVKSIEKITGKLLPENYEIVSLAVEKETKSKIYILCRPSETFCFYYYKLIIKDKEKEAKEAKICGAEIFRDGGTLNFYYELDGKKGNLFLPSYSEKKEPKDNYEGKETILEKLI